jgi:hypothetical protein
MDTEEYGRWGGHCHYEDHGMHRGCHHEGCNCHCHRHHGEMGFHRRFISQEEMGAQLEEYLKELRAEAKGVEERIAELKKKREPQQT